MFSVVLDACALYPAYLRDTLLRMAAAELYRPLWSTAILDELIANLPDRVTPAAAERIRSNMVASFPDALVSGHGDLTRAMTNHPKDRHVLAAAVRAAASAIVTFNLDDFPPEATEPYDVEVLHPDEFLLNQLDLSPGLALDVLRRQVAGYRDPAMDLFDLAEALERCGPSRSPCFATSTPCEVRASSQRSVETSLSGGWIREFAWRRPAGDRARRPIAASSQVCRLWGVVGPSGPAYGSEGLASYTET